MNDDRRAAPLRPARAAPGAGRTDALHANLVQSRGASRALLAVLDEERAHLRTRALERLDDAQRRKVELLETLRTLSAARDDLLAVEDVALDLGGAAHWLETHADERIARGWAELARLCSECRHRNAVNARIVELCHRHTVNALAILRGAEPETATVYARSGAAVASPTTRYSTRV